MAPRPSPPNPFASRGARDGASRSQTDLSRALVNLLAATQQNTRAQELLARRAESVGAQSYVSRYYQEGLQQSAYQARAQSAYSGAAANYLGSAPGQKAYSEASLRGDQAATAGLQLETAELEAQRKYLATVQGRAATLDKLRAGDEKEAAAGRLGQRQAELEAQRQKTPEYRAAVGQRQGAQAAESLNALRARVMGQQAAAQRAATPAGMAETRERVGLERQGADAEIKQAQQENIAQYGKLGGGILNAKDSMGRMTAAAGPYIAAASAAALAAYGFASAASPSAASTFNSSLTLLSAKIGHSFVPALDSASRAIQSAGNGWEKFAAIQLPGGKAVGAPDVGSAIGKGAEWGLGIAQANIAAHALGWDKNLTKNIDLPVEYRAGGDISEAGFNVTQSSINLAGKETTQQVLQEQLLEFQKTNELLTQMNQHFADIKNASL